MILSRFNHESLNKHPEEEEEEEEEGRGEKKNVYWSD